MKLIHIDYSKIEVVEVDGVDHKDIMIYQNGEELFHMMEEL